MATLKYRFPSDDPHAKDLRLLAMKQASPDVLQDCPALLSLVSGVLVADDAPTLDKARALQAAIREVIDQAFLARQASRRDVEAGRVLAAGALIGLVTEHPDEAKDLPSKTARALDRLKAARQEDAAPWLIDVSVSDRRGFARYEDRCLDMRIEPDGRDEPGPAGGPPDAVPQRRRVQAGVVVVNGAVVLAIGGPISLHLADRVEGRTGRHRGVGEHAAIKPAVVVGHGRQVRRGVVLPHGGGTVGDLVVHGHCDGRCPGRRGRCRWCVGRRCGLRRVSPPG